MIFLFNIFFLNMLKLDRYEKHSGLYFIFNVDWFA